jgi:hypothetical protein
MDQSLVVQRPGTHFETDFLSWHDGVDAMLKPTPDSPLPHVLVHVARLTNTPMGICAGGMLLINPEMKAVPDLFCFIATDEAMGSYYGPKVFKNTPFENAPVMKADIRITVLFPGNVRAHIEVGGHLVELEISDFDPARYYDRAPSPMPFRQNVIEARAKSATFKFNGQIIGGELPPTGIGEGLAACYSPAGLYYI